MMGILSPLLSHYHTFVKSKSYICEIKIFGNLPQSALFDSLVHHFIFRLMEIPFRFQNSGKIMFCHTSLFECTISHFKIVSRLSAKFLQRFTIKIANCLLRFVSWKTHFPDFFLLKLCFPAFSCLNVIYLIIKSQKQNIHFCVML